MDTLPDSITDGIRDTRLIERALRERWPIPAQHREAILQRQTLIAAGGVKGTSPREETSAFLALLHADRLNHEAAVGVRHEHHHTHELGPVTENNLEEHRAARAARLIAHAHKS